MFGASLGGGVAASTRYRHPLVSAMSLLLAPVLGARPGRRRGWSERSLALTALLMSLDDGPTLLDRFLAARALLGYRCGRTYQGFAKALERCGAPLVERIRLRLIGLHAPMRRGTCAGCARRSAATTDAAARPPGAGPTGSTRRLSPRPTSAAPPQRKSAC
jgi:hypothetical protein